MYHHMLRGDIWGFLSTICCKTLNDMITRAQEWEIEMQLRLKCGPEQIQITVGQAKRPKLKDSRLGGHQVRGHYAECGRTHEGSFHEKGRGCFSCGHTIHFSRDFPRGLVLICFHRNQVAHKKADCPGLSGGAVQALAPTTLRITVDRDGILEAPMVRSRSFQLQTGEI